MTMEGPGLSIFQGSDLKFNNSFQRAEEEEFAEENRKRDAELKDLFQDAFDDLNDEDDDDASSLASSQFSANQSDHEFKTLKNFNFAPVVSNFHELPVFQPTRKEINLETIPEKHDESTDSVLGQNHQRNTNNRIENDISGQHYKHCFKNGANHDREADLIDNYKKSESGGYEELKVLYEVRMREVERLRREVDVEREAKEEAIHQLTLCHSERNKALNEISDYQELISKSKDRISELEESVEKMKLEILELEKAREKDDEEVKISHQQVVHLEQKIAAMERCDASANRMKQMDAFIDNLNSKHQKELNILQNKIDSYIAKLEQKDKECRALESKLDEVERKRAALVLEKCDGASRQENALQDLLDKANDEKIQLNRIVVSLQAECGDLKRELDQYESIAKLRLTLNSSSDEAGDTAAARRGQSQLTRTRSTSSIAKSILNPHHQDIINSLRDELQRALLGKNAKRHEINKLQEQVRSKELQIQKMKEMERDYLSQLDSLKGYITRIVEQENDNKDKMAALEQMRVEVDRLAQLNQEHLTTIEKLNLEIQRLRSENKFSRDGLSEQTVGLRENELAQLKSQTDQLLKGKDSEWRSKYELITKECFEIKQLYMDLRKNNGRLTDQLELQKQHMSALVKEKDQILNMLKDKETLLDKLKEENIKYKVEKEMNRGNFLDSNPQDKENVRLLEQEVERLTSELLELPKKQTIELEGLKKELEAAKFRLIELEKRLRNEFKNEISDIIRERDRLKEMLEENNAKMKEVTNDTNKDIGVSTNVSDNREIKALKDEIEHLRDRLLSTSDPVYEKKLANELEELEKRLVSEHKTELVATEERIKNIMVAYYANHIEEIKKHFAGELEKIIANEEKKVEELTQLLAKKEAEIQHLKNNDTSEKLTALMKRIEEDRTKFTETLKQWSNQVDQLKKRISDDENKIYYLNQCLKTERKDAQKYKAKFDHAKKRIQQEKLENLLKIKSDMDNFKTSNDLDSKRINEKVKLIEMEFEEKERIIRRQYEMNKENRVTQDK